jgi:hypothetical protein
MWRYLAAAAALTLLTTVALSVMRTLFPRDRSSRAARWSIRTVDGTAVALVPRLPGRAPELLLSLCAPAALFLMAACWLVLSEVGLAQLAWAFTGGPDRIWRPVGNASLTVSVTGLLLAAFTAYLIRVLAAYDRRERPVAALAEQARQPLDAEAVLADRLRAGSRIELNRMFDDWICWFTDVRWSHVNQPVLVFARSAGGLCWLDAAVIVLDTAALALAVSPTWSPPRTRTLVATGSHCLQLLARQVGLSPPPAPVSLHGREERAFADTVRAALASGLPAEQDEQFAWVSFQEMRTQYAPHAAALRTHLSTFRSEYGVTE